MTELYLIRHGQAVHNLEGRWDGWGSSPLTQEGQRQAEALGRRLARPQFAIAHLYASPIHRAWQTAQRIAQHLQLVPVAQEGLREINFGQIDGMTIESFRQTLPELFARWQNRADLTFQYPDGEQRLAFFRRVGLTLTEIASRHPGEQIAIVAHGGTIRAGLAYLFPDTMGDWWAYALETASLTHVRVGVGGNRLIALNDRQHLDGRSIDG